MAANNERSFIMVKPDGVQRGLVGEIMKRFEQRGYKLVACKQMQVTKSRFVSNKLFNQCQFVDEGTYYSQALFLRLGIAQFTVW